VRGCGKCFCFAVGRREGEKQLPSYVGMPTR
jgi:hypothetical protein